MSGLYWLTNEPMARLEPYFAGARLKPRVDDRRVLSGIVFANRNGLRCAMHPGASGG
jgi:transposase